MPVNLTRGWLFLECYIVMFKKTNTQKVLTLRNNEFCDKRQ
jgi:hypothetical protein